MHKTRFFVTISYIRADKQKYSCKGLLAEKPPPNSNKLKFMLKKHIIVDGVKLEVDENGTLLKDEQGNLVEVTGESEEFVAETEDLKGVYSMITKSVADGVKAGLHTNKTETKTVKKDSIFATEIDTKTQKNIEEEEFLKTMKRIAQGSKGESPVVLKTLSIANSFTGEIPEEERDLGINGKNSEYVGILDLCTVRNVSSNLISYVAQLSQTGQPATTEELAAFPNMDYGLGAISTTLKKIAVKTAMSEETLEDTAEIVSFIKSEIQTDLRTETERQLVVGNGTSELLGVYTASPLLDAAAIAGTSFAGTVPVPTNFDVFNTAKAFIRINGKGAFRENAIMLNPADASILKMQKDSNGAVISQAMSFELTGKISGVQVLEYSEIPQGEFIMGDFSKFEVRLRSGVIIKTTDSSEDDFDKDIVRMKLSQRLSSFIKVNSTAAFIKGNFADIKTAITAL